MTMDLYWISGSPYGWRVQLTMAVKGIDHNSHRLDPGAGEHKAEAYLAINPRGRVPTLVDGETVVAESAAILAYLDMTHPEPPIFGPTAARTAAVWQALQEVDAYVQQPVTRMIRPIFFGQLSDKADAVREAADEVHAELAIIEQRLGHSDWLTGAELSAADIALLPAVQGILRAMSKAEAEPLALGFLPFADVYPNVAVWTARMEALPGYDDAFPPHWR